LLRQSKLAQESCANNSHYRTNEAIAGTKKLICPLSPHVDLRLKPDKLYNDLYFDTTPTLQPMISNTNDTIDVISNTNDTMDVNLVNRLKQTVEREREEFTYRVAHSHRSVDAGCINKQHDAVGSSEEESTNRDAEDIVLTINVQRSQVLKTDKGSYNFMNVKDFLKNKLPVDGLNYTRRFEFIPGRTIRSIFRLNGKMDYVGLIDSGASCSLIPLSVYRTQAADELKCFPPSLLTNGRVDRCVVMLAVECGGELGVLLLRLLVEHLLIHFLAAV